MPTVLNDSAIHLLLNACKHALRVCEDTNQYPVEEAIKRKALLITDLVQAMRAAGLLYSEMTEDRLEKDKP